MNGGRLETRTGTELGPGWYWPRSAGQLVPACQCRPAAPPARADGEGWPRKPPGVARAQGHFV